jgi:hypothetical protein
VCVCVAFAGRPPSARLPSERGQQPAQLLPSQRAARSRKPASTLSAQGGAAQHHPPPRLPADLHPPRRLQRPAAAGGLLPHSGAPARRRRRRRRRRRLRLCRGRPPPAPRRRPASRPIRCATISQVSAHCWRHGAAWMACGPRATALLPSGPATTTHARPAAAVTMLSCARSCITPSAAPSVRESERSAKMAPPAEGGAPPQPPRPRQRREVFEEGAVARRLPRQRLHPAPQPCRHGAQLYAAALQAQGALGGGSRGVGRPRNVAHGMPGQPHFEPRALPRAGMAADGPCTSLCLSREAQAVQQKRAQPQLPCEGLGRQRAGARQGWARRRPSAAGGSAAAVRRSPPMPRQSSTESSVGGVSARWWAGGLLASTGFVAL